MIISSGPSKCTNYPTSAFNALICYQPYRQCLSKSRHCLFLSSIVVHWFALIYCGFHVWWLVVCSRICVHGNIIIWLLSSVLIGWICFKHIFIRWFNVTWPSTIWLTYKCSCCNIITFTCNLTTDIFLFMTFSNIWLICTFTWLNI